MMSGESALLSRDSGEKPVPRGERRRGRQRDRHDARRVALARRRLTLDTTREGDGAGRAGGPPRSRSGCRTASRASALQSGESRRGRDCGACSSRLGVVTDQRSTSRRRAVPAPRAGRYAVERVGEHAGGREEDGQTSGRRRGDRAVLEQQEEVPPHVDAEIEARGEERRARRRSCRAPGRRAGWTASSRRDGRAATGPRQERRAAVSTG